MIQKIKVLSFMNYTNKDFFSDLFYAIIISNSLFFLIL